MKKILLIALFFAWGCQDHHFVPIEKAENLKLPTPNTTTAPAGSPHKTFSEPTESPQKAVMANAAKKEQGPHIAPPVLAKGSITLGDNQKGRDFSGFIVYVIAWQAEENKKSPVAVARYEVSHFPLAFSLDAPDAMGTSLPPIAMVIEARLDADGDPISKEKGDVFGFSQGHVLAGADNVTVVMDQDR